MHGHHLGVDAQRDVGVVAAAVGRFEGGESGLLLMLVLMLLQLRLQVRYSGSIESALCDAAGLESPAVEAGLVVVVAMADDFAAVDDDAAVFVVQGGLGGLLEAEGKVCVGLHCGC